jgi:LmbE family N-acetylglucosaminyl deacetylase
VPGTRTVILSPHLDDAVLSCWHLLDAPGEVRVLNVFAGLPKDEAGWWDRLTGATDGRARMRERLDEDRAALASVEREADYLELLDAQYRVNGSDPLNAAAVAALIAPHVDERTVLYAPLGGGEHADHRLTCDAALSLRSAAAGLWLYADVPHSLWAEGPAPGEPPARASELHRLAPGALGRKLAAVRLYRTQAPMLERMAPAGWLAEERSWRL